MIKYHKTNLSKTAQEVKTALQAMNDFISPDIDSAGEREPDLDQKLNEIWNSGDNLPYEFIDKTEAEEKQELAEAEQVEKLKNDFVFFVDTKVRPLRDKKLYAWVDDTFLRPLLYALTEEQNIEREKCRIELLDFPSSVTGYATDETLNDLIEVLRPSYITVPV